MYLDRITTKGKRVMGHAAAKLLTWLDITTRGEVLEKLSGKTDIAVETPSGSIRMSALTPLLVDRAKGMLIKETDTISWIDRFPENCVFWDVGANVGVFSLYAAAKRDVSVLSFEPSAANFYILSGNIELNGFGKQVTAYCIALSGTTKLGVLNMESPSMGAAVSQFGQPGEMSPFCIEDTEGSMHGMVGFSVDDFIRQFCPPFPNYLKLDVDGLELGILQGARETLHDSRLRSLMVELPLSDKEEYDLAVALLEDCGFSLMSQGNVQETEVRSAANHLFERGNDSVERAG